MPDPTLPPSPEMFFQAITAYQLSGCLKGAIDLDLFSAVGEGKHTVDQIAERCGASTRGIRALADTLVVAGFLSKDSDSYSLTPVSAAFLDRKSPACMANAAYFLLSPMLQEAFSDVAAAVRRGGTTLPGEGSMAPEHPVWVEFARSMAPMMAMPAQITAQAIGGDTQQELKVLDVAASHGMFGIAVARRYPRATITAVDWPNVLAVARENAEAAGISDRYTTIPGSIFEVDLETGYDVVLLPNFLHHFDPSTCEALLRKIGARLTPDGRVLTVEFIPNDDRVSPPAAGTFAMVMLLSTAHGSVYTFREFEQMFQAAGFPQSELREMPPTPNRLIISYRQ